MKKWVLVVLLIFLLCLTMPFVTADGKSGKNWKFKEVTLKKVDYKGDPMFGLKKLVTGKQHDDIEVVIDGQRAGIIPDDSKYMGMEVTQECLTWYPYGSDQWYACEVSRL